MPIEFENIRKAISRSLKGKINPRTKKTYTDSEIYAIATESYKSKYRRKP
ncbi:MAG: hypothetical protein ACFFG0_03125 [Candidatus Thorarchaeota archaeon]